jgi:DNA (cytosine-5)-methyltransferase 1
MGGVMRELALFAGAGGGLLGSHLLGWRTVCAVEIEPYCRRVLMQRQNDGMLEPFPIWDDVRTFNGHAWRGLVDVVSGGFPCQPFSAAGKNLGIDDPRNMWPDTIRVIREVGPRFCFLENVPNLLAHEYFGTILGELVESGYCVRWDCIAASAVGAPHRRDRLWIVADAEPSERRALVAGGNHENRNDTRWPQETGGLEPGCTAVAHAERERGRGRHDQREDAIHVDPRGEAGRAGCYGGWWAVEPELGRVADGVAHRVDRLGAIGNGQVPAVVRAAWETLTR